MKKHFKKIQKIEPKWLRWLVYFSLIYLGAVILGGLAQSPEVFSALTFGAIGYFIGKKQKPAKKKTKKKVIRVDEETGEILV
jgi:hypothetical protein